MEEEPEPPPPWFAPVVWAGIIAAALAFATLVTLAAAGG